MLLIKFDYNLREVLFTYRTKKTSTRKSRLFISNYAIRVPRIHLYRLVFRYFKDLRVKFYSKLYRVLK